MRHIYLVRHGEYDNPRGILPGRLPVDLSDVGRQQMDRLQKYLADRDIDVIYSSAVERCKQSATILSNDTVPIKYDRRLLETFSAYQGFWRNDPVTDWPKYYSRIEELGGETFDDLRSRVASFWDEIILNIPGNVVICSHGDPLYMLYCHITEKPNPDDYKFGNPETYLAKGSYMEIILEDNAVTSVSAVTTV